MGVEVGVDIGNRERPFAQHPFEQAARVERQALGEAAVFLVQLPAPVTASLSQGEQGDWAEKRVPACSCTVCTTAPTAWLLRASSARVPTSRW